MSIDNIEDSWARLKNAYGDTKIMMSKKIQLITKLDLASRKSKGPSKIINALGQIINLIKDLMLLAELSLIHI